MGESVELLDYWYRVDENNIPAMCILRPIMEWSTEAPSEDKLKSAQQKWLKAEHDIVDQLGRAAEIAASKGLLDKTEARKFTISGNKMFWVL